MSQPASAEGYARVILETIVEQWQTSLNTIADALEQNPTWAADVKSVDNAFPKATSAPIRNFVRSLVQDGNVDMIPQVVSALGASLRGESGPQSADITSAIELSDAVQEQIRRHLAAQYGEDIILSFDVDPALMGGLRIRVGDRLDDSTIVNRLAALRELIAAEVR